MPPRRAPFLVSVLSLCCASAWAETESACPTPLPYRSGPPTARAAADPTAPIHVWARDLQSEKDGVTNLEGMAELTRGGDRITADHMRYEKSTNTVEADGDVQFRNAAGDRFRTEELRLQLDTRIGEIGPSRYTINNDRARGDAARIEFLGPDYIRLTDARYTTCRAGQDDWFLKVSRLDLDTDEDIGTAWHATIQFFDVPIFYFPYASFPISDERKSGFLFPRAGHSTNLGYEFSSPYYFNLAPNYDATVTPRLLTKRGLQLQDEFRYLTRDSNGILEFDILPNDKVTEDDRAVGAFRHRHTFSPFWSGNVDIRWVSDKDYFGDFGDRLGLTSQTQLPQTADVTYRGPAWTFTTRLADHQTIDRTIGPESEPYARLPQIQLMTAAPPLPNRWHPQLESEWNRFTHETLLAGERLNLNTGLSLPLQNDWAFFTPKVGARYIGYHLDRTEDNTLAIARSVLSLDTGLFFERDTRMGKRAAIQTLEPRLFYLRIPQKDLVTQNQDTLPNFDSGLPDPSFLALFRENRFTGGDRIGDANQITTALTTRFIDADEGIERLRLSMGRIYYFDDPEVNLPPGPPPRNASNFAAEASALLVGNWHARATLGWNTHEEWDVERSSIYLQYHPARDRIINLGHVFVRDQVGQYDGSFAWPVAGRWSVRARSLWSAHDNRNLETYAGVEYNACCWALRVFATRRWKDPEQQVSFLMELQLTGLSKLGRAPESPLKQSVFTFDAAPRDNAAAE